MNAFVRMTVLSLCVAASTAGFIPPPLSASEDPVSASAARGRALTTDELYQIYRNRSWMWADGAAHFTVSKRKFTAYTKNGAEGSYADGIWFLTDAGKVCFRAAWNGVGGSSKALTCFAHRTNEGNIYQRRLPDGDWYVFSHRVPETWDEIRKLKRGDNVRSNYLANKRYIDARAPKTCSAGQGGTLRCRLLRR